jgi:signal transduction histidine kinase
MTALPESRIMAQVPLRVKFLVLLLLGVVTVTLATLLMVRWTIEEKIRAEIASDLRNSVLTFKTFQRERETTRNHAAELLADLPTVKALMTTADAVTIQDASAATWRFSGSDLLALADPKGKIMAVYGNRQEVTLATTQEALARSIQLPVRQQWWFLGGHLYEVFFQPIYSGGSNQERVLGVLALGYEINEQTAEDVGRIAGSQVAFLYGDTVVASTIAPARQADFIRQFQGRDGPAARRTISDDLAAQDLQWGQERYLATSLELTSGSPTPPRLVVLKSYDVATARFGSLYRKLVGLGCLALLGQSLLVFAAVRRYTRPLEKLVAGVRALGLGDFNYPLDVQGRDELAEVTASFVRMRDDLRETQQQLLESEKLATVGRMANSISHDLRHQLTPMMANAEFLLDKNLDPEQAEELYQEIRDAVRRMTELLDSLLEFGKTRKALSPAYGSVKEVMERAIRAVQSHPSVYNVNISFDCQGNQEGWFDPRKMEQVFYNLLLNASQATSPDRGKIEVVIREHQDGVEITIRDNGVGIPEHLRHRIFEPFVSYGKENGTGLGLTIARKLLTDHRGFIEIAESAPGRTTFRLLLPLETEPEEESEVDRSRTVPAAHTSTK